VKANNRYTANAPSRAEIDQSQEPILLEFGTEWCGHCQGAQPLIASALAEHPNLRHLKIEDGPGRPLGRSFRVKLWPTLIFLRNGEEVDRLVRPDSTAAVKQAAGKLAG
jgi:thioredoxin 1|tara:strand:+ start:2309 stop:2635 length:327 start_codon:yes stop_codon:yes gene_type:complete